MSAPQTVADVIASLGPRFDLAGQQYTLPAPKPPLIISGEPAECPTCEGSGQVMASGTDWEVADEDGKVECSQCEGKGYQEESK